MTENPEATTPPRVQTTVRLPPDLLATVDRLAKRHDISRTEFIVRALRQAARPPAPVNFEAMYE